MAGRPTAKVREPTDLGARILKACAARGMTQTSLETKLVEQSLQGAPFGFSRGYMSKLIYGERGLTALGTDKLIAMADALHVSLEWLAAGRGPMEARPMSAREEGAQAARTWGAEEDAIEHVLATIADAGQSAEYWRDVILAENKERRRRGLSATPKVDAKNYQAQVKRNRTLLSKHVATHEGAALTAQSPGAHASQHIRRRAAR